MKTCTLNMPVISSLLHGNLNFVITIKFSTIILRFSQSLPVFNEAHYTACSVQLYTKPNKWQNLPSIMRQLEFFLFELISYVHIVYLNARTFFSSSVFLIVFSHFSTFFVLSVSSGIIGTAKSAYPATAQFA